MFKSNTHLGLLVNFPTLNENIVEYIKEVKESMRGSKDDYKVKAIKLF